MSEAMLSVIGLDVAYGGIAAVRNLSFEVGRGEIVGLIGPNGAGKSTTLNAIMGLVAPSGRKHRARRHGRCSAASPRMSRAAGSPSCQKAGGSSPS